MAERLAESTLVNIKGHKEWHFGLKANVSGHVLVWGGEKASMLDIQEIYLRISAKTTTAPTLYSPSLESVYKEVIKASEDSSKRKQKESSQPKLASVGEKGTHHDPKSAQAQELIHAVQHFTYIALRHSKQQGFLKTVRKLNPHYKI